MDKTTHEIRIANWKALLEQCHARPEGQTARQWLLEQGINEKSYYYWQRKIRQSVYEQITPSQLSAVQEKGAVTFAEIPVQPVRSQETISIAFRADAVIQVGNLTVGLSNSVSDTLLKKMLEAAGHVS